MNYTCTVCQEKIANPSWLESHKEEKHDNTKLIAWKIKEEALRKQMYEQESNILSDLLNMREKEISDAYNCNCQGFCRIFHNKHNWKASWSQKVAEQLKSRSKNPCILCKRIFDSEHDLKKHSQDDHKKSISSEDRKRNRGK